MEPLRTFFLYSFLGFCLEWTFARLVSHETAPRKCLLVLPICPVYGLGALAILFLPASALERPEQVFLLGSILATAVEYLCSLLYERLWRVHFWDYAGFPGCVRGRICLPFSLGWGILSLAFVYVLHPITKKLLLPLQAPVLSALLCLFLSDTLVTTILLRRTGTTESLRWSSPVLPASDR